MVVIKVELWRGGNPRDVKLLGVAKISNVSKHDNPRRGDYRVTFYGGRRSTVVQRRSIVLDFPRRSLIVWDLIYRALREAYGGRNR